MPAGSALERANANAASQIKEKAIWLLESVLAVLQSMISKPPPAPSPPKPGPVTAMAVVRQEFGNEPVGSGCQACDAEAAAAKVQGPTTPAPPTTDWSKVPFGQLTFDAEGLEAPGTLSHSRVLHVPSDASGLTIGRGYDMKLKTPTQIIEDLTAIDISPEYAKVISNAGTYNKDITLSGDAAKSFIRNNNLTKFEITPKQQYQLFIKTYPWYMEEAKRLATKDDVNEKYKEYGLTDWTKLDPTIKELLVDLLYRGDNSPEMREIFQKYVIKNDLKGFRDAIVLVGRANNVPSDRQKRRLEYLDAEIKRRGI